MKSIGIIRLLCIASCSFLFLTSCAGSVGKGRKELEKVVEKGEIIIDALEEYKKDSGEYPIELSSLYPKYISHDIELVYDFSYAREDQLRGGYFTDEEIDGCGGYQLVFLDIKQWVLSSRTWYALVYRQSKLYPERKWTKPKKRIKDWALIVIYRRYGSKENPIVGPGV